MFYFYIHPTPGGHHVWQLGDVGRHLVATPPLNFAVVLPRVLLLLDGHSGHLFTAAGAAENDAVHPAVLLPERVVVVQTWMNFLAARVAEEAMSWNTILENPGLNLTTSSSSSCLEQSLENLAALGARKGV